MPFFHGLARHGLGVNPPAVDSRPARIDVYGFLAICAVRPSVGVTGSSLEPWKALGGIYHSV